MSRRYQSSCLFREKRKGIDVWVFRYRDGQSNRKEQIGSVEQFPTKSAAMKACEQLRANINRETKTPRTLAELIAHYTRKELSAESRKAHSTREVYGSYIKTWVHPKWGARLMRDVRTVDVEAWVNTLTLANSSRAKVRNIMSAIFNHAMRYEWLIRNPMMLVRQSAKRERLPDVLTAEEIGGLLAELSDPSYTAVLLAATTGLRVSELLALKWSDVHFAKQGTADRRAVQASIVGAVLAASVPKRSLINS